MMISFKKTALECYFLLRLPLLYAARFLFASGRRAGAGTQKILVIRPDRLGDLILSVPFLESLRAAYPSARIDIMVRPYIAELARIIPAVDDVIVYNGLTDSLRRIRSRRYDIVVDMLYDHSVKTAFVALFSGSPVRIGFSGGYREVLFTDPVDVNGPGKGMAAVNLELLKPLGAAARTAIPRLGPWAKPREKAGALKIAIHPGGYYASQRWSPESFAELGRMLADRYGANIVVVGGPDERTLIGRVAKGIGRGGVEEALPSMRGLADLLSGCDLVICNNSGPLHLAAALGVPTVSTMGPSDPALWWPSGEGHIVVRKDVGCNPCSRGRCSDHRCLKLITPWEMFEKASGLIKSAYGI